MKINSTIQILSGKLSSHTFQVTLYVVRWNDSDYRVRSSDWRRFNPTEGTLTAICKIHEIAQSSHANAAAKSTVMCIRLQFKASYNKLSSFPKRAIYEFNIFLQLQQWRNNGNWWCTFKLRKEFSPDESSPLYPRHVWPNSFLQREAISGNLLSLSKLLTGNISSKFA